MSKGTDKTAAKKKKAQSESEKHRIKQRENRLDETLKETFPASDATARY